MALKLYHYILILMRVVIGMFESSGVEFVGTIYLVGRVGVQNLQLLSGSRRALLDHRAVSTWCATAHGKQTNTLCTCCNV